jgi:ankyrin repeat protein
MARRGQIDLMRSKLKKGGPTLIQRYSEFKDTHKADRYHILALERDIKEEIDPQNNFPRKLKNNKSISPLHIACVNPDITVLRKFYNKFPDYSNSDHDGRVLMHYAACNQTDVALDFLISKGIPVNVKDRLKITPLMLACELGRVDNVSYLIKAQLKLIEDLDPNDEDYLLKKSSFDFINIYGPYTNYTIHYAVKSDSFECVKALVDGAGDNIDIDVNNFEYQTPLILACCQGNYQMVEYLLMKGAS